ncbi:phosphate ABC transporter permease PstA [Robiginitomaculum antarcticum]|uniref:phosphate ABC transporter permease PstA n=1 Tax=Robiginitomaculum antarcticum TaxID=437507 RepID=UPI0003692806|nr:phosphate ABC transporter permease PstA [Robiginitomaculum antarcticum]
MISRAAKEHIFAAATRAALGLSVCILAFLLGAIIVRGAQAISLDFLFMPSRDFGSRGGISYQIFGSLLIVLTAGLIAAPLALGASVYRSEYIKNTAAQRLFDLALYGLNGVPSIIFGLFGLILFVNIFGTGLSWFVGAVILAIMMLPTACMATISAMRGIDTPYRENAYALGLTREQTALRIIIPQSLHGLVTGLLIGLARAIGETAPIMFIATAFSGAGVPSSLAEPVATLPTHILALAQQAADPAALQNAWGASFTLIALVAMFSLAAFFARARLLPLSQR